MKSYSVSCGPDKLDAYKHDMTYMNAILCVLMHVSRIMDERNDKEVTYASPRFFGNNLEKKIHFNFHYQHET
jgi:hypothetical protein